MDGVKLTEKTWCSAQSDYFKKFNPWIDLKYHGINKLINFQEINYKTFVRIIYNVCYFFGFTN